MKLWLILMGMAPAVAFAQLRPAPIFSDNMVLQRDRPVHIWGKGRPGRPVFVSFANEKIETVAGNDGSWSVFFSKQKSDKNPRILTIQSNEEKFVFTNILMGDIWICSGQSNMEWPLNREQHWAIEKNDCLQPLIRTNNPPPAGRYVYGIAYTDSLLRRLNLDSFYAWSAWKQADSNTAAAMSAVGWYFAKAIITKHQVPIGLINLSIGGAPIESFISRDAMKACPRFNGKLSGNWLYNEQLPAWTRQRGKENLAGHENSIQDGTGPNHAYKPGFAYQSGILPLLPLPVKGIIWYQGESNSQEEARVAEYGALMHLLADSYRSAWQDPNLSFYWVQLSSIDTVHYQSKYWPAFRDEQRRQLDSISRGGMAVSSDVGLRDNVHPTDKKIIGERLSRWALKQDYGDDLVPSGPIPIAAEYDRDKVVIQFRYSRGLRAADGQAPRGFSFDAKNPAYAVVQGDKVIIPATKKPAAIYYGWLPYTDANLINQEGLPASTFKIELP